MGMTIVDGIRVREEDAKSFERSRRGSAGSPAAAPGGKCEDCVTRAEVEELIAAAFAARAEAEVDAPAEADADAPAEAEVVDPALAEALELERAAKKRGSK